MNDLIVKNKRSWLITEYDPKYCELLCQYAYEHFDIDGFYGKYNISPEAALEWEEEYEDWRNAVMMAEYRKKAGLAEQLTKLLEYSRGVMTRDLYTGKMKVDRAPDIDLMQKVLFKMLDNNLKIEKDTGLLKRQGLEKAKKAKSQNTNLTNSPLATKIAQDILEKNN